MSTLLLLLTLFQIKHFICGFPLQAFPYQYKNKGTYLHLGGILHAGIHFIGTSLILIFFTKYWLLLSIVDFILHYHIDWAKMNINKRFNLKPDNSEWFWIWLGIDQLLHQLTYITLIYYVSI